MDTARDVDHLVDGKAATPEEWLSADMPASLSTRISSDTSALPALSDDFVSGMPQSASFVRNWQAHANADCFIAALYDGETPVLMLPLEVVKSGPARLARFPGGTHANGNFPILASAHAARIGPDDIQALMRAIQSARPDIDALLLARQFGSLNGLGNPLLCLKTMANPNPVLSASLGPGFEAVLERSNAKRKRKKHRQHTRRYEEAGGYRIVMAKTPDEAHSMLDRFFAIKSEHFARTGIDNVFGEPGVQAFFHALFGEAAGKAPRSFEIKALEVAGIIRAVIGKSFWMNDLTVEFAGIAHDDLTWASPGEYLFFEDIMQTCGDGDVSVYSFGIGDEPYKRDWCDILEPLYDSMIGLTFKGRVYAIVYRARNAAIARIKANVWAWRLVKRLRGWVSSNG